MTPSLIRTLLTLFEPLLVTHTKLPSLAIQSGAVPTVKFPWLEPRVSLGTLLVPLFTTQMFVPSNAIPVGVKLTGTTPRVVLTSYHRKVATWSGFRPTP